jgi:hypothetical protein
LARTSTCSTGGFTVVADAPRAGDDRLAKLDTQFLDIGAGLPTADPWSSRIRPGR